MKILRLEDNHITAGLDDTNLRWHLVPSSMNTTSIVGMWRTGSTETTTGNTTTTNTENALPLLLSAAPVAFERFSSDCAGTKPKVVCPCCTVCCGSSSSSSTNGHSGAGGDSNGNGGNSVRGSSSNSNSKKKEET